MSPGTPTVTLRPMTPTAYEVWVRGSIADYAAHRQEADASSPEQARDKAEQQFAELLPRGLETPDHELFTLDDGDREVGMLWIHSRTHPDGVHVFGYDFAVDPDLRRHGYGRAALEALEVLCRERGVVALELNVFGPNLPARALYESVGFAPTSIQMRKVL